MERKYYLRGLGLGIVVTAVIMGVALSGNKAMTNDEIIARAKELGLVENTVLSDTGNEDAAPENAGDDPVDGQNVADQPPGVDLTGQKDLAVSDSDTDIDAESEDTEAGADGDAADETDRETDPEADEADGESEDAVEDEVQDDAMNLTADDAEAEDDDEVDEVVGPATIKVITINSGDGSYTVAKKLEDVGVVTSASTFDTFLCQNGYDKSLRTGTFSIPTDASDEQIARIVTGRE